MMAQLSYLRELTDQLASRAWRPGLVLLSASASGDPRAGNPWKLIARHDLVAEQFRRRLNGPDPVVHVAGLSRDEVGAVLRTMERLYRDRFPDLALAQWATSLHGWLNDRRNNPADTDRVRMRHVVETVNSALATAWAERRLGLRPDGLDLYQAAVWLTVRGFTYSVVDLDVGSIQRATAEDE